MNADVILDANRDRLMAVPGVTGVGIGSKDGRPAIVILVKQLTTEVRKSLPQSLEGCPVVVEQSGDVTAF